MLLVLEGGYNLHSISRSCEAAVRVLLGEDPVPFPHDFGAYSLSCAFVVELNVWLAGSFSFCYDSFLFLGGGGVGDKRGRRPNICVLAIMLAYMPSLLLRCLAVTSMSIGMHHSIFFHL